MTLLNQIKKNSSVVFRRAFVKRRDAVTGLFEANWQDITNDIKKWGKIKTGVDDIRPSKLKFNTVSLIAANDQGRFNPEDDEGSLWFGFSSRQRSLVKIEAGFIQQTLSSGRIWSSVEFPSNTSMFIGLLQGDMGVSAKNEINLNIRPLLDVFREFPASEVTGFTSTGGTASQFMEQLRDMTDGAGVFVFRPFFQDTTTFWDIQTTTAIYSDLNTNTSVDLQDINVWQVVEKLAESEAFVAYVDRTGVFKFRSKTDTTVTSSYEFHGVGSDDNTFGRTIKKINSFGKRLSKYYSRVSLKWDKPATATSYVTKKALFAVDGTNDVWKFGFRSLNIENLFIPDTTTADTIALNIFNEFSALKNEISFSTSFISHLEILDRIEITYDSPEADIRSLWDLRNWGGDTSTADDLIWDASTGDAIKLVQDEFKLLSIEIDLDKFGTTFIAKEL